MKYGTFINHETGAVMIRHKNKRITIQHYGDDAFITIEKCHEDIPKPTEIRSEFFTFWVRGRKSFFMLRMSQDGLKHMCTGYLGMLTMIDPNVSFEPVNE